METVLSRRQIKDQSPQTQLGLKHTKNCVVLPDRLALLDRMPQNARAAEIGVAFGEFSAEIIQRCTPQKLYLCDAWSSDRYRAGLDKIRRKFSQLIKTGQVEICQGLSTESLAMFGQGDFDWAYIDTNHTFETTLAELQECGRIVGEDGRIAGHDFCTGNVIDAVPYGVVEAVTKFCKDQDWQFEYLTVESRGHFSFCLKRLYGAGG